jgi:CDP-paratose 2-epimerase
MSDISRFKDQSPDWELQYDVPRILQEIYEFNCDRWRDECTIQVRGTSSGY